MTGRAIPAVMIAACAAAVNVLLLTPAGFAQQITELQPNLIPFPASDVLVVIDSITGAPTLRFSTVSWNSGAGPVELIAGDAAEGRQDVYQRVYLSGGGFYDRLAGNFEYHETHNHFHFEGYALYTLQPVNAPGGSQRQGSKTSFCLLDNQKVNPKLPGAPKQAVYTTCSPYVQGISVGWGDKYGYQLAGQSFDLTDQPDGDYELTIEIDPEGRLLETNETDNVSCVRIRINVANGTVQVLGTCAAAAMVTLSSISPSSVSAGSSVDVTIKGFGFAPGMSVGFENGSGPAPVATGVVVVDGSTITATVSVKAGGPPRERVWDVRVSSAVLLRGFKVVP